MSRWFTATLALALPLACGEAPAPMHRPLPADTGLTTNPETSTTVTTQPTTTPTFTDEAEPWLLDLGDVVARCVVEDNGLYPMFHGCYDWHSAVHGFYALHVVSRITGDPTYVDTASALMTPSAIEDELALVQSGALGFEVPYGFSWFLALARERGLAGHTDLDPMADEVALRLRAYVDGLSGPELAAGLTDDDYANLSWAVLNTWQWGVHTGDVELTAWAEDLARNEILPRAAICPIEDDLGPGTDFFPPCLHLALVLVTVLPPDELSDWIGSLPSTYPIQPLTAFPTVHVAGLNFSRSWGLHALWVATGDPAYEAAAQDHLRTHYHQPAYWGQDFQSYAHWVPQFGVYGIALWF